ncbi:hypothetical protein [Bartonella massiliensis]|uniref:hypothetical protein n=1 Tax=Bartonella massiliensis TaxID=929795 RepID=UPI00163CDB83|nr:hypothetical protein [Bartonella massiliensis]
MCDDVGLFLIKRKDGGAQWIYHYTIHGRHHEMGMTCALRDASLKQAYEYAMQWHSVLRSQTVQITPIIFNNITLTLPSTIL